MCRNPISKKACSRPVCAQPVIGQVALRDYTSRHTFRDGVLTCRIRSSVVRSHLGLQTTLLCHRLNELLQGNIVQQIKLI